MKDRIEFFDKAFCSLAAGGLDHAHVLKLAIEAMNKREELFNKEEREYRELYELAESASNWVIVEALTPFGSFPIIIEKVYLKETLKWVNTLDTSLLSLRFGAK